MPIPEAFESIGIRLPLLVTGWIALGLLVLAVVIIVLGEIFGAVDGHIFVAAFVGICGALLGVIWLVMLWPYSGEYHRIYQVHGNVTTVSNVLTDASGDITRQPVLELDTVDRSIVMNDPRAVNLEGRDVTLTCTVNWVYASADRYACNIHTIGELEAGK